MRFNRNNNNHESEDSHFWISISDLMTSLLFVFILILIYMVLAYQYKENIAQRKIQAFEENVNARTEMLKRLQKNLLIRGINVEIDSNDGTMRITKEKLFDSSKARVRKNKRWIIRSVAKEILYMMAKEKYRMAINTIFIEGHTDNIHLNKGRCGFRWTNMELSAQRAINTFLLMDSFTNGAFSRLKNRYGQAMISYSGYADTRPIKGVSNDTPEGRERNRRIQFFFAINPPDIESIKNEH